MKGISAFYTSIIVVIGNLLLFGSLFSMDETDPKNLVIKNECNNVIAIRYEPRHVAMPAGTYIVSPIQSKTQIKLFPLAIPILTFMAEGFEDKDLSIVRKDLFITVYNGSKGNIIIVQDKNILGEMQVARRKMESISSNEKKIKKSTNEENCSIM
jgi:hypothetical protein